MKATIGRIVVVVLFASFLGGCLVANQTGLHYNREKGSTASGRIIEAAIVADLVHGAAGLGYGVSIVSLVADRVAKIKADEWYVSSEVDDCVESIDGLPGYALGSLLSNFLLCDLESDHLILDTPFPEVP